MSANHKSQITSHSSIPATAKIYIAGHRGLVGSAIVRKLQSEGYDNFVFRTSAELDLRNQAAVNEFFAAEKPGYVFLAAAKVGGIHANDTYPADFIRDNLLIQTHVIDAAYRNGATKLAFLGSSCIYPKMAPQPMPEDCLLTGPLEPTNQWYAIAKIAGIRMCQAYRRQYGFNAICLMPTNLYGPNDNFDLNNSHVLPALIRKFHLASLVQSGDIEAVIADEERHGTIPDDILTNLGLERAAGDKSQITNHQSLITNHNSPVTNHSPQVILWGSGAPRREFLHADDLADACLFLMQNYDDEEIVNIGVGDDIEIRILARMVQDVVGFGGSVVWDNSKSDGAPRKLMDVTRLHDMGWTNRISLEKGIKEVYAWYQCNE